MIKWQLDVVRPNKLFIGNSRLVSDATLNEVISLATRAPRITRTGLRFDVCNREGSWPLFKEHCRSVTGSLLVCLLQAKKGVPLKFHLKTVTLLGALGELIVLVTEEMRERTEQFELLLFFLPV